MVEHLVVGPLGVNCCIVSPDEERGGAMVVDPGGDASAIIARLRRLKLRPTRIVLTHGHWDHCAASAELAAAFSRDGEAAPALVIHRSDARYLGPGSLAAHEEDFARLGALDFVRSSWDEPPAPGLLVDEGDSLAPFTVFHTPGHTPGSIALYDAEAGLLISGDTLFAGGIGRTDLPYGDPRALGRSLRRILELPPKTRVIPGHGPETTIGKERLYFN